MPTQHNTSAFRREAGTLPALALLAIMAVTLVGSSWNDSAIFDETAHISAAYSYVSQFDYRLNPEHPPLIKVLSALPLYLSRSVRFPTDTKAWQEDINGQWDQGQIFLYRSGNDPDHILFWMRFPIMALAILFAWFFFRWIRRRFGTGTALLTLTFLVFSPTLLAHSRFVTTDVGAALGFFIALAAFIRMLEAPSWKTTLLAGVAFGVAQAMKFSLFLLVPMYFGIAILWAIFRPRAVEHAGASLEPVRSRWHEFWALLSRIVAIGAIGIVIIWLSFAPFTMNYPPAKNRADAEAVIGDFKIPGLAPLDLWLISQKPLQPIGQYVFGLMMMTQRAAGGNTQYFLGEITSKGSRLYFPLLYLLKEPIAYHLISLLALIYGIRKIRQNGGFRNARERFARWVRSHPAEFVVGFAVLFYWAYLTLQPLNLGIRHVLPTFPFLFFFVAKLVMEWIRGPIIAAPENWRDFFRNLGQIFLRRAPRATALAILLLALAGSSLAAYPNYLSYFNAISGGMDEGYRIATDSNYDWGQDLVRLKQFVENPPEGERIDRIAVDYFGGGNPRYYLGEKFEPWWSSRGYPTGGGWLAVSANTLMGAYGKIGEGFSRKSEDSYEWLRPFRPIARAGTSIFIYHLPER